MPSTYVTRRRFSGYTPTSNRAVELWNDIVHEGNRIRQMTAKEARVNIKDIFSEITNLQDRVERVRHSVGTWFDIPFDKESILLSKHSNFGPYIIREGMEFDTLLGTLTSIANDMVRDTRDKYIKTFDYIGPETSTGHPLYYDNVKNNYVTYGKKLEDTRMPERMKEIKKEDNLEIEWVASIDTDGGNEPFVAEVHGRVIVSGKGSGDLKDLCKENGTIQSKIEDFVRDNFDEARIQKRAGGTISPVSGKSSGYLYEKVMKSGAGFKVTGSKPTNRLAIEIQKTKPKRYTFRGGKQI